jgi:GTP-binding protein
VSTQSIVAVVGRPNVGKSTLVNRLIGRREAVVEDTPGVTRDRVYYDAEWNGRPFTVVDTGGWESDAEGLSAKVAMQAEIAIAGADLVLFVVDAEVGPLDEDDAVVKILRRTNKPVLLVANKVDGLRDEADIHDLWNLGLGEPMGVSALHGRGSGELLDRIVESLPEESQSDADDLDRPRRVEPAQCPCGKRARSSRFACRDNARSS